VATFLTPAEVAARWSCSPRHVRRLAERHQLPGLRVGGAWRFSLESVEAFEAGHTTSAETVHAAPRSAQEVSYTTTVDGFTLPADYEPVFPELWGIGAPSTKKTASVSG
jgi:excisionase family DNA binding protein